ncbi:hypothetical protein THAOC_05897 [Thalassiosira oceanica]|uniref:Subtilisin n=1 Tax=Thalassiosira oceanica TaxID=159749 RepID=K0T610_THAOC|nr:hypothetical protein THAOC_05897 [Thalassiosira oceanica]|eukprot:EJK72559.1 hypothetical protein THAOC_05897 [Thalassiosira oceanica]
MVSLTSVLTAAVAMSIPSGAVGLSRTKTEIHSRNLVDASFVSRPVGESEPGSGNDCTTAVSGVVRRQRGAWGRPCVERAGGGDPANFSGLVRVSTVVFDECVGLFKDECITLIQNHVANNPAIFDGLPELNIETKHIRQTADSNYYLLGLRTDETETNVVGVLGDGMIFYPWQWCLAVDNCIDIGPWDCDVGESLSVEQCCNYIKGSMPQADMNGNYLDCYVDPPIGSASNPADYTRVQIHVDEDNRVKHAPRNE